MFGIAFLAQKSKIPPKNPPGPYVHSDPILSLAWFTFFSTPLEPPLRFGIVGMSKCEPCSLKQKQGSCGTKLSH